MYLLFLFRRFLSVFCIFLVILPFSTVVARDPYEILGIRRNASPAEIKKAYKELAKLWHPDKNKGTDAERNFIEINRAYGILNDPDKKAQYDRYGGFGDDDDLNDDQERNPFADFHFGSFGQFQYQFHSAQNFFKKHDIGLR